MKINRLFAAVCILLTAASSLFAQSTQEIYFASDPALTPNGDTIVFSYDSDLWKVPAAGGTAVRLTGMDGEETAPNISPDGQWLAFSSNQYGNNDVYLMPLKGGTIQRLTYHQGNDKVDSWSWDSNTIFFTSDRYNRISVYKLSRNGGTPARLFGNYHNTVHNYVESPVSDEVFFNESWESFIFPQRKHYRGPFNPDIKSYNPKTGEYKTYTHWEGKDFWPMVDRSGKLYFVSDQANSEYNLYTIQDGNKKQLTDFSTSVRNPSVSADGSTIVFEKEYRLYTYDTASGKSQEVPISVFKNNTLQESQDFNAKNKITSYSVSPDKKKLAFVSRGELFVSDIKGKFIREIETAPSGRVLQVLWLKDNKTLLFNQTVNGFQNWFSIAADGSGAARQHTDDARNNRMMALNPDLTQGVYLSGRDQLRMMDLKSFKSTTIVNDKFWGYQNDQPRFSPDGAYIMYAARRNFETDLFAYHIADKKSINLTKTGVSESDPFWSPDGKYVYFSSSRTKPSYPRGGGDTDIYRMPLQSQDKPYASEEFDKLFKKEKADTTKKEGKNDEQTNKEKVSVSIQQDGLMNRLEQVGASFGSQSSPFVIQKKGKTYMAYLSNHDEGQTALWITTFEDFEKPETKKVKGINGFVRGLTQSGDQLYGLSRGTVYKIDPSSAKATKIDISESFNRNLRAEFDQMFDEVWANIQENYYNETLNNIDWKGIRERYHTYLPHVHSRADFRRMMNDMLGELNSSHMGFSTSGPEEKEYYSTVSMATGLLFEEDKPYTIREIVKNSPADVGEKDIQPGDVLVAVNGKKVDTSANRESYFTAPKLPEELSLTLRRNGKEHTVKLHPENYFSMRTNLYDAWIQHNQQKVDQETNKKVAYVYMKNMSGGELNHFLTEMTSEGYRRDALILDLRYNTGGNVHNDVLQFLSQRPYVKWKYRDGKFAPQPNFAPAAKPIILLTNEQSLSDAEVTAAGFKALGLGTIVGMPTYRWIIFTSGKGLVDGSFYRLPSWGVYTLSGKNLEHTGVEPDIKVDNTFKDRLQGKDPQLERAIKEAMKQLNK